MKKITDKAKNGREAAEELRRWIDGQFDAADSGPMVTELCAIWERLFDLRQAIRRIGVVSADGQKNPLLDQETKVSASFARAWRILGLADAEKVAPKHPAKARGGA